MSEELENKKEVLDLVHQPDTDLTRTESIKTTTQNQIHTEAIASNPDQFPSIANLLIPNKDQIEPFQITEDGRAIAASRKTEKTEILESAGNPSFHEGLKALPEGATPEQLAKFQTDYILRKASSINAAATLPVIKPGMMLEGRVEKTQTDNNEFYERMAGTLIGTVQGIGNIAVNLATIADFCAYALIGDRQRGSEMLSKAGNAIAETTLTGIKLFHAADNYLYQVGFEGDYSKPFKDISILAQAIDEEWQKLPPREQERLKVELITQLLADGLITHAGCQPIGKANKLTEIIDAVAENTNRILSSSKDKIKRSATKISNTIDELLQPVADTGTGIKMKIPPKEDLALKMESQQPSKAFRGDDNLNSKIDKLGFPKSHINDAGDLVPADIKGLFKGRPVDIMEHICDVYFKEEKAHSPFTSLSISDESAMFFGNRKITVDLIALRTAIKDGSLIGTELIEHLDLLKMIDNSLFDNDYKKMAKILVRQDKEMLVKGPIPARFLEIHK